jgi:type II secretory pathway pseudopilin PulG
VLNRLRSSRGVTIIETTVILAVMFILAGAMSPIVSESITTARAVKAKNDASMIAMGIINFQKDVGSDASTFGGSAGLAQALGFPDVLVTSGSEPTADSDDDDLAAATPLVPLLSSPAGRGDNANNGNGRSSGRAQRRRWRDVTVGALDDHLMTNRRGYRYRRPGEYGGWNGPYLSADIKGDPWGNQYMVNAHWLDGGTTAADKNGNPRRAVFVVSSGANGVIETPYEQPITDAGAVGDDVVIRIQ